MEEWKEYKLGDVSVMKNGKKRPQSNGCYPVYGGNGIMDYSSEYNSDKTIIVGRVGAYCGCVYKSEDKCWVSDNAIAVSPKDNVDLHFLYYLMKTLDFHHHHIGGAQPLMTQDIIGSFDVRIPGIIYQKKISSFLANIDDKIEVNRRINENLEQQAQALFKSWFVDFEPFRDGEFVESELGMIPKGWKVKELADIAEISKISINPQKQPQTEFKHYSIPSYDDGMKPEIQLGEDIKSNKFVIRNKMTLFSKLNPRIKRVWFVDKLDDNSICSTEFVPYHAKEDSHSTLLYSLINSQGFYDFVMSMVNGATGSHQRFHPEESLNYRIAYNEEYGIRYCKVVTPILNQILENRKESRRLAELRDTLLPKLMSGEININEINSSH